MIEGLHMNHGEEVNKNRELYDSFRSEILHFKDLPESTFSDMRDQIGKIEPQEGKNSLAHSIIQKINENSNLTNSQKIELTHLWEEEILGLSERRTMTDDLGNLID